MNYAKLSRSYTEIEPRNMDNDTATTLAGEAKPNQTVQLFMDLLPLYLKVESN